MLAGLVVFTGSPWCPLGLAEYGIKVYLLRGTAGRPRAIRGNFPCRPIVCLPRCVASRQLLALLFHVGRPNSQSLPRCRLVAMIRLRWCGRMHSRCAQCVCVCVWCVQPKQGFRRTSSRPARAHASRKGGLIRLDYRFANARVPWRPAAILAGSRLGPATIGNLRDGLLPHCGEGGAPANWWLSPRRTLTICGCPLGKCLTGIEPQFVSASRGRAGRKIGRVCVAFCMSLYTSSFLDPKAWQYLFVFKGRNM